MSFASARAAAQSAKNNSHEQAIRRLAEAVYYLSQAVESELQDIKADLRKIKRNV